MDGLCDDSEVHVLEDHLSQLSGNYLILYSFEITSPYQIIPVSNVDGIIRQMNLEELLTTLLTGDTESFYLQDYQRNTAPCEPQAFNCNSAEQVEQQVDFNTIKNEAQGETPNDYTYPARFYRTLLCDGTEAYLHQEELQQLEGSYSTLQELVIENANQEIQYGNTFTGLDKEDLFYLGLHYNDHSLSETPATNQKNGNIDWLDWQVVGETRKAYQFYYDDLDRLTL